MSPAHGSTVNEFDQRLLSSPEGLFFSQSGRSFSCPLGTLDKRKQRL
ncbi:hypothetical protein [Thermocoleostomius sinensis]|uniref:Uncharacterized protein n=1 Tax=Thermocoleostomius sinensis A174 TaxID=2016057 RepID=A0A9E8Z9D4_9CYAN|nr:hypothetical protein [Thermocoleostomius sinensis]WAL58716.1 hypothetical protein OXH18_16230 [Thermocoleostomius sinensis A174]